MKLVKLFKKGQKGITLVELMVVMAILAVLASIIFPAVSGTQEVSVDSQTKQDASTVANAMNDYFADQTGAEVITSDDTNILATGSATNQSKSSRWPESFITTTYNDEFPTGATVVSKVTITPVGENATAIVGDSTSATALVTFVNARTAINFGAIGDGGTFVSDYVPVEPKSSTDMSSPATDIEFHNYLWLAKKSTAAGGVTGGSRVLEIYKLVSVTDVGGTYELSYQQIY